MAAGDKLAEKAGNHAFWGELGAGATMLAMQRLGLMGGSMPAYSDPNQQRIAEKVSAFGKLGTDADRATFEKVNRQLQTLKLHHKVRGLGKGDLPARMSAAASSVTPTGRWSYDR